MHAQKQLAKDQTKHCAVSPIVSNQGENGGATMIADHPKSGTGMLQSAEEFDIGILLSQLGYRVVVLDANEFEDAVAAMDCE